MLVSTFFYERQKESVVLLATDSQGSPTVFLVGAVGEGITFAGRGKVFQDVGAAPLEVLWELICSVTEKTSCIIDGGWV